MVPEPKTPALRWHSQSLPETPLANPVTLVSQAAACDGLVYSVNYNGKTQAPREMLCPYLKTKLIKPLLNKALDKYSPHFEVVYLYIYILIYIHIRSYENLCIYVQNPYK